MEFVGVDLSVQMIEIVKKNLKVSQNKMNVKANKHRRKFEFQVGVWGFT